MRYLIAILLLLCLSSAHANVRLHALFSDNMVLQQGVAIPVWGWAEPGEKVTVTCAGKQVSVQTGETGKWMVKLPPLPAGGPVEFTVAGKNTITLQNVLVGEVWLCAGQSNMQLTMSNLRLPNEKEEFAKADFPQIRAFNVGWVADDRPRVDSLGKWEVCTPQAVGNFSAVAYHFATQLQQALKVPVGVINCSWGATAVEAWMGHDTLAADPELGPLLAEQDARNNAYAQAFYAGHAAEIRAWLQQADQAAAVGKPLPQFPVPPMLLQDDPRAYNPMRNYNQAYCFVYNGILAPLMPFGIKGVAWYQGEQNAARAAQYVRLLPAMIGEWRREWGQGDFPFLIVQLPNIGLAPANDPSLVSHWASLRQAQLQVSRQVPNTGLAVTIDIGGDLHPKNKVDVGKRLQLLALGTVYGQKIEYSGPLYKSMQIDGNAIRLQFDHRGEELAAAGGAPLKGFAIAGEDRKYVWADAVIEGDCVVVRSERVPNPVAARYAWADFPPANLTNSTGLPASPFCTDPWPPPAAGKP